MATWMQAKRKGMCPKCQAPLAQGDTIYFVRAGVALCEPCGHLEEDRSAQAAAEQVGEMEEGVLLDLANFPPEASKLSLARAMVYMARQLDRAEVSPREVSQYTKELRLNLLQLKDLYPETEEGDATDVARKQRERRMREINGM